MEWGAGLLGIIGRPWQVQRFFTVVSLAAGENAWHPAGFSSGPVRRSGLITVLRSQREGGYSVLLINHTTADPHAAVPRTYALRTECPVSREDAGKASIGYIM